jgi:antibiotic biosynthesis monooxygenase (ABM) superfamily enzyme
MSTEQPVTVTIGRTVLPGREAEFEALTRAFAPKALTFPGHLGVHVLKPADGVSREYQVVLKFATRRQWEQFLNWPDYQEFRTAIRPLLEQEPRVEELCGLESWFTLPGAPALRPLPRWKMALVTLVGVYPTSLLIGLVVIPFLENWPHWLRSLVFAVLMVVMLTWLVMPLLTRAFRPWLYPPDSNVRTDQREKGKQP